MKIKRILVKELWDKYTFSIKFNKEVTILIGKNGSGKSTILNLIYKLLSENNSDFYDFKKIELSFLNSSKKLAIEQKSFKSINKIKNIGLLIDNNFKDEIEKIFDEIKQEILGNYKQNNEIVLPISKPNKINHIFLSTFDMRIKDKEVTKKHYNKSYIKTELDVILNDLITNYKLYLLNLKKKVENIQNKFDNELEKYSTNGEKSFNIAKKLIEKKDKINKIYRNRDLFEKKINNFFKDTEKEITLDENNSIVFQLKDKSYLTPYQLSSGEKQILIIMLNVMLLEKKSAILLMDEPEISLHVEWQRILIKSLIELNPNLQIIIATHSPAIVSKYFRDKIVNLSNFHIKD